MQRALKRHGFAWVAVPKKCPLSDKQLAARKAWVDKLIHEGPGWWANHMSLGIDGVTLTKAPRALSGRQKHAAQAAKHTWMKRDEKVDPQLHTFNRYGVKLGEKVLLWGGFTGTGHFPSKIRSPRPKMSRDEWVKKLPVLRRSVYKAGAPFLKRPMVWQDNETFLQAPAGTSAWACES